MQFDRHSNRTWRQAHALLDNEHARYAVGSIAVPAVRLHTRTRQLEQRLSELLGEHTWQQSGLGAPIDIDALNHKITQLQQQTADLRIQLNEREDKLAAARGANRGLMTRINRNPKTR